MYGTMQFSSTLTERTCRRTEEKGEEGKVGGRREGRERTEGWER